MTISPNRSLADVCPGKALLWADFKTQFDITGVRKCNNLATAPGAPKYLTMGDGVTSTTFPTQLVGKHGVSFDGGDYIDTGIVDPFDYTSKFTFVVAFSYVSGAVGYLYSSRDVNDAASKGIGQFIDSANNRIAVIEKNGVSTLYAANTTTGRLSLKSTNIVAITRTSALATDHKYYANGEAIVLTASSDTLNSTIACGKSILLGTVRNAATFANYFIGNMYFCALFPFELTPQQVQYMHRKCILGTTAA